MCSCFSKKKIKSFKTFIFKSCFLCISSLNPTSHWLTHGLRPLVIGRLAHNNDLNENYIG